MKLTRPYEVYFDFDNTITSFDVLDAIIQRFAISQDWERIEEEWAAGRIGSRECLEQQFALVRATRGELEAFLSEIRVDPAFPRILAELRARGIEPVVISDSFVGVIRFILENNGIHGLRILANELSIEGDRAQLRFPYFQGICTKCGNCKTSHLARHDRPAGTTKIYVGDGRSDICPAGFCEVVFAKASLLKHFRDSHPRCLPFEALDSVLKELPSILQ